MYAYIKGILVEISDDNIVLECNNIGYNICVPSSVISKITGTGSEIKIYTYTCVREDAFMLYGFLSKDDLWIFKKLITVNGIGPKGALGILSTFSADDLRFAIMAGDAKRISKAPGIGNKSAERIILDLKDKITKYYDEVSSQDTLVAPMVSDNSISTEIMVAKNEAVEAMVALGYSATDAMKAVNKVLLSNQDLTDSGLILKQALKNISTL